MTFNTGLKPRDRLKRLYSFSLGYVFTYVCVYVWYIYIYVCVYVWYGMYVCVYMYVCMYVWMDGWMDVYQHFLCLWYAL